MQTFLPCSALRQSIQVLDWRRLGKQRVEAYQILRVLDCSQTTRGWQRHPAVRMWAGFEACLARYHDFAIHEWLSRGYQNTMLLRGRPGRVKLPPWLGDPALHASHRSNLLRKDPVWYGQFGWPEGPDLPYVWPTNNR